MRARPRLKGYKKTKRRRCPKCQKVIIRHQVRCKNCSRPLPKVPA